MFWGDGFVFGLVTDRNHFDVPSFKKVLQEIGNTEEAIGKTVLRENLQAGKGKVVLNLLRRRKALRVPSSSASLATSKIRTKSWKSTSRT